MTAFEVVSAFTPAGRLARRSATLDGAVPVRVAQACVPLLEGNALGHQVVFDATLIAARKLGVRTFASSDAFAAIDRAHRAAVPLLVAEGLVTRDGAWHRRLARGWFWTEHGVFRVWTGLLVRPPPGTWLRIGAAKNRAIYGVTLRTTFVGDGGGFVPLVLDFQELPAKTRLEGEVATVMALPTGACAEVCSLSDAPELAEAHAAFYDARYFATKKGEVTRKYRRMMARATDDDVPAAPRIEVAPFAGPPPEIVRVRRALDASSVAPVPSAGPGIDMVRFTNAVGFTAHFDGNSLAITPDARALADGAEAVTRALDRVLGSKVAGEARGALLYLTKYFTPHPRGEPHFFVKPWAFTRTSGGWSSVVEGIGGDGYDVMRGVVATDRFHATPAVFQVVPLRRIAVPRGAPLVEVFAIRRDALGEDVATRSLT